jgi:hypothetical protein
MTFDGRRPKAFTILVDRGVYGDVSFEDAAKPSGAAVLGAQLSAPSNAVRPVSRSAYTPTYGLVGSRLCKYLRPVSTRVFGACEPVRARSGRPLASAPPHLLHHRIRCITRGISSAAHGPVTGPTNVHIFGKTKPFPFMLAWPPSTARSPGSSSSASDCRPARGGSSPCSPWAGSSSENVSNPSRP